jgi:hypothetical protein
VSAVTNAVLAAMSSASWMAQAAQSGPGQQPGGSAPDPRLDAIVDIVVPETVSLTPVTVGWQLLAGVLILALFAGGMAAYRRYRRNRYRREALAELKALSATVTQAGPGKVAALRAVPVLLRRVALTADDRAAVASLSGDMWLDYLDARYPGNGFGTGPGREVEAVGYLPEPNVAALDPNAVEALIREVRSWIESHEASHA